MLEMKRLRYSLYRERIFGAQVAGCIAGLSLMLGNCWAQTLTWIEPPTFFPRAVSSNGVIVGVDLSINRAYRWRSGSLQDLGAFGEGLYSDAYDVSADGSIVVGYATDETGSNRAFRWENGQMEDIGATFALGISPDGNVIVGYTVLESGGISAFRWTRAAGTLLLPQLGGNNSGAVDVSENGNTIVGWSLDSQNSPRAVRWESGNIETFDVEIYMANAISANGSVVVGWMHPYYSQWQRAFRWTPYALHDLGALGVSGTALGVSGDGSVIVGYSNLGGGDDPYHRRAFIWRRSVGALEEMSKVYRNLLSEGEVLLEATSISPNGRYIAGVGLRASGVRQAFLIDRGQAECSIPGDVDNNGLVDDADLLSVLFSFGTACPD